MTHKWLPLTGDVEQTQAGSDASNAPSNATQPHDATLLETRRGQLSERMTSLLATELAWARMKSGGKGDRYYPDHRDAALADINNNPLVQTTVRNFADSVIITPRMGLPLILNGGVVPEDGHFRLVGHAPFSNNRPEGIVEYSSLGYDPKATRTYTDKDQTDLSDVSRRLANQTLASIASYGMPNSTFPPNASSALSSNRCLPVAKSTDVGEKMESCFRDDLEAIKEDYGLSDNMPLWGLSAEIQSVDVDDKDLTMMMKMKYYGGDGPLNGETIEKGMVLEDIGELNLGGKPMSDLQP
ncbi:hypothetical protein L204_105325 [Cryptococcus depauperatus]|nr:hypothetical protein L204_02911 [Cryptococcus depauperatus CBS 7855]